MQNQQHLQTRKLLTNSCASFSQILSKTGCWVFPSKAIYKYSEDVVGAIRASSWSLGNWPNLRRSFRFQGFFVAALKAALRSAPASLRWDPALVTFILNHRQQTSHGHTQMTTCQGTWLLNGNSETQLKQESSWNMLKLSETALQGNTLREASQQKPKKIHTAVGSKWTKSLLQGIAHQPSMASRRWVLSSQWQKAQRPLAGRYPSSSWPGIPWYRGTYQLYRRRRWRKVQR